MKSKSVLTLEISFNIFSFVTDYISRSKCIFNLLGYCVHSLKLGKWSLK